VAQNYYHFTHYQTFTVVPQYLQGTEHLRDS
jgi:hypothetical protein